jgi:hypothetical protein
MAKLRKFNISEKQIQKNGVLYLFLNAKELLISRHYTMELLNPLYSQILIIKAINSSYSLRIKDESTLISLNDELIKIKQFHVYYPKELLETIKGHFQNLKIETDLLVSPEIFAKVSIVGSDELEPSLSDPEIPMYVDPAGTVLSSPMRMDMAPGVSNYVDPIFKYNVGMTAPLQIFPEPMHIDPAEEPGPAPRGEYSTDPLGHNHNWWGNPFVGQILYPKHNDPRYLKKRLFINRDLYHVGRKLRNNRMNNEFLNLCDYGKFMTGR